MRVLFLLVNGACDIACAYCFYTTGYERRDAARIRPSEAGPLADRIRDVGFASVILTGGDPLQSRLKGETYALVAALKERGLRVIVNTSAAFLTESDLDRIVALGVDRVDVSIDSHLPEIHDAQRGRHADAVAAIDGLLARGHCSLAATVVVTPLNAPTLADTVRWLRERGVTDVRIQRAFLPESGVVPLAALRRTAVDAAFAAVAARLPAAHVADYAALTADAWAGLPPPRNAACQMGKSYFVCGPDGRLTPCFHRPDVPLGNLLHDPIEDVRAALDAHPLRNVRMPACFGTHCASLFDNPRFWQE